MKNLIICPEIKVKIDGKFCYNGTGKKQWLDGCPYENGLINGGQPSCDLFGTSLKEHEKDGETFAVRCQKCKKYTKNKE